MKIKILNSFDYILLICVITLVTIGILFIYSSGVNSEGVLVTSEYVKQIVWGSIGIVLLVIAALYDYRKSARYVRSVYIFLIAVLVYTFIFGREVSGAKSWIGIGNFGVQPSEFGKFIFIMFLAKYLSSTQEENQLKRFLVALIIFSIPTLLILAQPDLGTASVYIPIFLLMCFMANIPLRYIFFIFAIGMTTIIFTVLPLWNEIISKQNIAAIGVLSNTKLRILLIFTSTLIASISIIVRRYLSGRKYFYWIAYLFLILTISLIMSFAAGKVLKDYQISRLIVFLDPYTDPKGAGWNIIQSKIAIGSGGMFGRSFLQGTQSHYRFLPQQSTDFIFSILSEEFGFLGGVIIFILYAIIFIRTLNIMQNSSGYGCYIATGILAMFFFHFFINIGMVMGIMPITGIPLLFLSYGGSSLWSAMICIGLLMSINHHKYAIGI